jgi:Glucodextranase, domain B/PASTA domain
MRRYASLRGMGFHRLLLVCTLGCLILAAPASAAITSSSITSPANGTELFFNGDNGSGSVTVRGTVTGATTGTRADLDCYAANDRARHPVVSGIDVSKGTFAINASLLPIAGFACRLAIVPAGSALTGTAAAPFGGPAISVTDQFSHSSSGNLFGYYILSGNLNWAFAMQSAGECPVHASYSTDSSLNTYTLLGLDSGSVGMACLPRSTGISDTPNSRSALEVDGLNAYLPGGMASFTSEPGFIPIEYGAVFNPAHDTVAIIETDAPMICDSPGTFPPTPTTCPSLHDSGVRLTQVTQELPSGQVVRVTQTFTSIDGRAHMIDAMYGQSVSASQPGHVPEFEFPGQTSFAAHAKPDEFTQFPAGASSIIVLSNDGLLPATENPIGAITYSRPPQSADFISSSGASTATLVMRYTDALPAGGSVVYDWSFEQASSTDSLASAEQIERDRFGTPNVTITNPPSGTVMRRNDVRIQGRVSDSVGITALNVGGRSVSVRPGGVFGVTLRLRPGLNTIVATATNIAGRTGDASVRVRYNPVPCHVPRLKGASLAGATRRLAQAGCGVGRVRRIASRTVRRGRVISSSPKAGSRHPHGWRVALVVSGGRPTRRHK